MSATQIVKPEDNIILYTLIAHISDNSEVILTHFDIQSLSRSIEELPTKVNAYSLTATVNSKRVFKQHKFNPTLLDNMMTAVELAVEGEFADDE